MDKQELIKKITQKKEFSKLPKKDVALAFKHFDKDNYLDEEKIKLTRDLLRKIFSVFTSQKLLSLGDRDAEWILKKHISTRERLPYYPELYKKLLGGLGRKIIIFDLGAGVNGFSYKFLQEINKNFCYIGIEAIGQLVDLVNYHFKTRGVENCHALHLSLFELGKIKKYIKQVKEKKIVFLFKTLDSLEMLQKDYSKELLNEIAPLVDRVVVSFATRSLVARRKFRVNRDWFINFIKNKFEITNDFELGSERYVIFKKR